MGTLTVNATNGQTVAAGASYTVSYPAGKSAADYLTTGAKITTSDGSIYSATVSLGGSSITITNPTGRAIASGGFDYLDLNNAGVVARFGANGESDVLLGPKMSDVVMVTEQSLPVIEKRQAIRTAIEAAARSNAFLLPPHTKAPTWTINTVYIKGQIVRGAAAGSTNNLYMMHGSVPVGNAYGTSAGAVGPTGIGPGLVTDNGCCWEYVGGISSTTGTYPLYSTVIPTTASDVMDGYFAIVDSTNLTAMGLTQTYRISVSQPLGTLTNGPLTNPVTLRYKNSGTVAAPNRSTSSGKGCHRFITNAKKWLALKPQTTMGQYSLNLQAIKINGQFLSETGLIPYLAATSPTAVRLFDLSRFPAGDKEIEIFFLDAMTTVIYDVYVQAEEYLYAYEPANDFKIAIEGDSITDMSYGGALSFYTRFEVMLQEMLGSKNAYNNCIGSTGLISTNSGTRTNYLDRLDDIILFDPDLLVIAGIHNDDAASQSATTAALAIYLDAVRAALPDCTICIQGGNTLASEAAAQTTNENKLLTAYNAWSGDKSNTFFVPIFSATPALLAASATGYFFNGNNSPVGYTDGHPCWWYYKHIVPIVANAIRKFYRAS